MTAEFDRAVAELKAGGAVVFPTDTVYGLGVAVNHAPSPEQIFRLKHRDQSMPVAWLVADERALLQYGCDVPPDAIALARRHWPGALTIIVKASDAVPAPYRSQQGTIGLRAPASETAQALIAAAGPLATSSANISGQPAPRTWSDVDPDLIGQVAVALQGDVGASGVASTVLDCSHGKTVVIRQGDIMPDQTFTVPFSYASHDGKSQVNAKLWTNTKFGGPDTPGTEAPKAVIQLVHGMAEYIDRYDDFANYLVSRGFVVCAEDHIGHGGTAADSSEFGHMPAHGGKDILLRDAHTLYRLVSENFPGVPYVLYGHSMGSFISRAYIARYGNELTACVLSGTGNVPAPLSKFGRSLARMLAATRGETYRSAFIDGMGAGGYGKQIKDARTNLDWLSTDPAVVDAYIADDKCGFMFTVGGYSTLLDLTAEVVTPACAAQVPKDLPLLFAAGDGDPVGDMGKGVRAAAQLYRDAGVKQVDELIYEGMRHEIHNEVDNARVYDDVASWIEQMCQSSDD